MRSDRLIFYLILHAFFGLDGATYRPKRAKWLVELLSVHRPVGISLLKPSLCQESVDLDLEDAERLTSRRHERNTPFVCKVGNIKSSVSRQTAINTTSTVKN